MYSFPGIRFEMDDNSRLLKLRDIEYITFIQWCGTNDWNLTIYTLSILDFCTLGVGGNREISSKIQVLLLEVLLATQNKGMPSRFHIEYHYYIT